ncbi:MAG: serine hydrolase domain-containing protein [Caulobacter sp.]|nr:serine hydrolase domain-containing protein [Caulobacter sp.]
MKALPRGISLRSPAKAALAAALSVLIGVLPAASPAQSPVPPAPVTAVAPVPTAPAAAGVVPLPPAELEAYVDGLVRDAMSADHIPGVTVSVVQNGQVVLKKGYGFAGLGPARPVDPDRTLFRIASISKTFTWIAVMREVEAGRMRLDAPVNLYLPEKIQVRDQGYDRPVRVIDLMSHSPGFEDRALGQLFERDARRVRPLAVYLRQERPRRVREAGSLPAYSNYGVGLAGAAAAWVSGKPFERLIETGVIGPLGMTRTTFRDPYPARPELPAPMPAALARDLADGYLWTGGGWRKRPYEFTSQIAPAGGASTTAADMARYMTMILNGGTLDGVRIYGPATAAGFFRAQSRPAPDVAGFGHGFAAFQLPGGRTAWGHDGVLLSFRSSMMMVPELGLGVFVAANSETGERLTLQLTGRIVQRFYGPAPTLPEAGSAWLKQNGRAFEGQYVSSRRSYRGLEQFIGLINTRTQVSVTDAGQLLIRGFNSSSLWVPEGTGGRFREVGGWRKMSFVMQNGRAVRYFSPTGAAASQRVGFFGGQGWLVNLGLLAAIAALATLGGLFLRDRKDHRETPMQRRASLMQTTQAVLWLLAMLALAVWADKAGDVAAVFFDWPGGWMLTASSCALVAAILSFVTLVLLPFIWRGGRRVESWTVGRKLRFTATTLIYTGLSLVLGLRGALFPWAS